MIGKIGKKREGHRRERTDLVDWKENRDKH